MHGLNTIARVWRESIKPEDPVQAYMRIFGLNEETFADEQYMGYAHIASMDIEVARIMKPTNVMIVHGAPALRNMSR